MFWKYKNLLQNYSRNKFIFIYLFLSFQSNVFIFLLSLSFLSQDNDQTRPKESRTADDKLGFISSLIFFSMMSHLFLEALDQNLVDSKVDFEKIYS
jgi:hypothetical protein